MNLYGKILFILKHEKEVISCHDFKVIPTYFYSTISQLIKDGLVESIPSETDSRKRLYRLTDKGKTELKKKTRGFFLWNNLCSQL